MRRATIIKTNLESAWLEFDKPRCSLCREDAYCLTLARMWQFHQPSGVLKLANVFPKLDVGDTVAVSWGSNLMLASVALLYGIPLMCFLVLTGILSFLAFTETVIIGVSFTALLLIFLMMKWFGYRKWTKITIHTKSEVFVSYPL